MLNGINLKKQKSMKNEYWLFTLLTEKAGYINCWYKWFPSKHDLIKACNDFGDDGNYAIVNITNLTEEQFNKLTID